jgi:ribosome-interacting GTPase 1
MLKAYIASGIVVRAEATPEQIAKAVSHAEWAARAVLTLSHLNPPAIEALAQAIKSCPDAQGILVTQKELIELVELRSPMWRQIVDFD